MSRGQCAGVKQSYTTKSVSQRHTRTASKHLNDSVLLQLMTRIEYSTWRAWSDVRLQNLKKRKIVTFLRFCCFPFFVLFLFFLFLSFCCHVNSNINRSTPDPRQCVSNAVGTLSHGSAFSKCQVNRRSRHKYSKGLHVPVVYVESVNLFRKVLHL